jgi:hypothetical protein
MTEPTAPAPEAPTDPSSAVLTSVTSFPAVFQQPVIQTSASFTQPTPADFPAVGPVSTVPDTQVFSKENAESFFTPIGTKVETAAKDEGAALAGDAEQALVSGGVKTVLPTVEADAKVYVSTKVVSASAVATIATALTTLSGEEIVTHVNNMALATSLSTVVGTLLVGALSFGAGYLRKELARLP